MTLDSFAHWLPSERVTESRHGRWKGGRHIGGGYVRVKVKSHPKQDKRGYMLEHVLVMEEKLGRYLRPGESVHHIDGNRQNNDPDNLELMYSHKEHMGHHPRKRNENKQFIAVEPIFEEIKFRLHDVDAGVTKVYSLSKLINTTFRRGKFQFRGRSTGLTDKNGKEIFEGDIIRYHNERTGASDTFAAEWRNEVGAFRFRRANGEWEAIGQINTQKQRFEVIGNIWENPSLLGNAK